MTDNVAADFVFCGHKLPVLKVMPTVFFGSMITYVMMTSLTVHREPLVTFAAIVHGTTCFCSNLKLLSDGQKGKLTCAHALQQCYLVVTILCSIFTIKSIGDLVSVLFRTGYFESKLVLDVVFGMIGFCFFLSFYLFLRRYIKVLKASHHSVLYSNGSVTVTGPEQDDPPSYESVAGQDRQ